MKLKYHGKLEFSKLKYPKSGKSLYIFETVVDSVNNTIVPFWPSSIYMTKKKKKRKKDASCLDLCMILITV